MLQPRTMSTTGLQFEYKPGCLKVQAAGRGMLEHKVEAIQEIASAIAAQPVNAVLVDMRALVAPFSFMDRYQLGELAGRYLARLPLAVLALESQVDRQRIGQLVAVNRGAKLEIFTDPVVAESWLEKFAAKAS